MKKLIHQIRKFDRDRDWDKYHSPKNLAMALSVEAGEILEIFRWLTEAESGDLDGEKLELLKEEIGDVMICLTNLADKFGIDPIEAAKEKIRKNEIKYPAEIFRSRAEKYSEVSDQK